MTTINRDIESHSRDNYDLIIIGGGIYGVMLLFEASRRNVRCLMVEEKDFGGQTSLNHLRTVHGGLRYLQTLDLKRFFESVKERKWFLRHMPHRVNPMACLMPLYGKGLKRRGILRMAVLVNDLLSLTRNRGVPPGNRLPRSRTVSAPSVEGIFPGVEKKRLQGGAVWYDGAISEYQRLLMEILKTAVNRGGGALNYLRATELLRGEKRVRGITGRDMESGREYEFLAPRVINAAGPWSRELAGRFDRDHPALFPKRLLNWNILFDRESLSPYSLGLTAEGETEHTYFFHNWKNRLLVGTGEQVVDQSETETLVSRPAMETFMGDLNGMVPELDLSENDILRVYSGVLPATPDGRLAVRETLIDHGRTDGPEGLFSISGVKFTTARLVAEKTIRRIFPESQTLPGPPLPTGEQDREHPLPYDWLPQNHDPLDFFKDILKDESVVHLGDLLLRRTSIGDNPARTRDILDKLRPLFPWDDSRWKAEVDSLEKELNANNIYTRAHTRLSAADS